MTLAALLIISATVCVALDDWPLAGVFGAGLAAVLYLL